MAGFVADNRTGFGHGRSYVGAMVASLCQLDFGEGRCESL